MLYQDNQIGIKLLTVLHLCTQEVMVQRIWIVSQTPSFLNDLSCVLLFTDKESKFRAVKVIPTIVSQRHTIFSGSSVRFFGIPQWILRDPLRMRPEPGSFIFQICQTNPKDSIIWNWCNKALLTFLNWNNFVIYSSRKLNVQRC